MAKSSSYEAEPAIPAARRYSPGTVVDVTIAEIIGSPSRVSTSYVERQSMRMASRRFTRLTNGYSKRVVNHAAAVSLYAAHFNWVRVHMRPCVPRQRSPDLGQYQIIRSRPHGLALVFPGRKSKNFGAGVQTHMNIPSGCLRALTAAFMGFALRGDRATAAG
jgi:hypothetical protein